MQAREYTCQEGPAQQCIHADLDKHALVYAGALLLMPGAVQAMEYMGTECLSRQSLQHVLESTAAMQRHMGCECGHVA